ncbi:helix-turn-helix domain-containing protein [Nocardioides maradonensis]
MEPYLAELSRTIDVKELGRRIRNARIAAGMTQAEVVGGEVTPAYLSRIEDGQRRPEATLLERMAARMGTTLEKLLGDDSNPPPSGTPRDAEIELSLDYAELALVSGDSATALEQSDALLTRIAVRPDPELQRRALRVRAGALEATGDLNGAILVLEGLAGDPTPDSEWLKSLIALARCYRDSGEFAKAIDVGKRTEVTIAELEIGGLTEAIQLTVTIASAHEGLGNMDEAMRTCMRALGQAEKFNSPIAKASAYWNASSIRAAMEGATPATIDLAKKALALFELGQDNRNLAKLKVQVANLHLQADPADVSAALEMLEGAERELDWSDASAWDRSVLHIVRGRAHAALGDFAAVSDDVARAREVAPLRAPMLHAVTFSLEGRVAMADGRIEQARDLFRKAALELTAVGADREAAELWFELANLLTEAGDVQAAVDAFRSAGASSGFRLGSSTVATRV